MSYKEKFDKYSNFGNVLLGENVRELLCDFQREVPELKIYFEPSGKVFGDWIIPREWVNNGGYLRSCDGSIEIDLSDHPLRLVQYSNYFKGTISSDKLVEILYKDELNYDALPYVTNYYGDSYGICLNHVEYDLISKYKGDFEILIDTEFKDGFLYYADYVLKGNSAEEVLISSYICHPWMANNELSGPILLLELIKHLKSFSQRRYTYRFVLVPETIGSIVYINKNYLDLKQNTFFGLNLTCIGDERAFSMISGPPGNSVIGKIVKLSLIGKENVIFYDWFSRGSDERQYNSPGVELDVVTICRSKFGKFIEYHSSNDFFGRTVTENGMSQSFEWLKEIIWLMENNLRCFSNYLGEPHMSKYNLYPKISARGKRSNREIMDFISLCNGRYLVEIGLLINMSVFELKNLFINLVKNDIIKLK